MLLEHFAQPSLEYLAGSAMRNLGDKDDLVGQLPFGELVGKEIQQFRRLRFASGLLDDDQERPLVPFRMGKPITAASATSGYAIMAFSTSIELIHSPPDLMTSLLRSTI